MIAGVLPAVLLVLLQDPTTRPESRPGPSDMSPILASLIAKHDLPGMAALLLEEGRLTASGVAGVRRRGLPDPITPGDRFHLGSCTKAMTATLAALLVRDGRFDFDTTLGTVFAGADVLMDHGWRDVTLMDLLTHRGGAPTGFDPAEAGPPGDPPRGRAALARAVLARPPATPRGARYAYSNTGYVIAGAVIERVTGRPFEELMTERIFRPLGMGSAGFGPPGSADRNDEPSGHDHRGRAHPPGPGADNPPLLAPAGTVHASLRDLAKFVLAHLPAAGAARPFLDRELLRTLHSPPPAADPPYAAGWLLAPRPWARGDALTHAGSNTLWYAVIWLAPELNVAVLVACNQGGDAAARACDEAAAAMISRLR